MSKAFTREAEGEEALVRELDAALPEGVRNYLTPAGMEALRESLRQLRADAARATEAKARADSERRQRALQRKLERAEVVDPRQQAVDEVRFGVLVTVRDERGRERTLQIVGVDEASAREGRISWLTPLAKALTGAVVGDLVSVESPRGAEELQVVRIRQP